MIVKHLPWYGFDHASLCLKMDTRSGIKNRKAHPFCFEAIWLKDESLHSTIKQSWEKDASDFTPGSVTGRINKRGKDLKQ